MKKRFQNGVFLLMVAAIASSCGNEARQREAAAPADSASGQKVRSVIDSLVEIKREELIIRTRNEVEAAGKKIVDLAVKQKMAEARVKESIGKEIGVLEARRNRLREILLELKNATKESLQEYEKQVIEIIKE